MNLKTHIISVCGDFLGVTPLRERERERERERDREIIEREKEQQGGTVVCNHKLIIEKMFREKCKNVTFWGQVCLTFACKCERELSLEIGERVGVSPKGAKRPPWVCLFPCAKVTFLHLSQKINYSFTLNEWKAHQLVRNCSNE